MNESLPKVRLCRIVYEFAPRVGGSITDTVGLCAQMNPHCASQVVLAPKSDMPTVGEDRAFCFEVIRIPYHRFRWLSRIKGAWLSWLPLAPLVGISFGLSVLPTLHRLVREGKVDLIHAHGITMGMIASIAGRAWSKPVVWTLQGSNAAYSLAGGLYEDYVAHLFPPDLALVMDDGSPAKDRFARLLPGRVVPITHAIDASVFQRRPRSTLVAQRLGVPTGSFVVVFPHSLLPVKGADLAIRGFAAFMDKKPLPNAYLVLVGDGPLHARLMGLVTDLNLGSRVIFAGEQDHASMPEILSNSDVALATSLYSNMNLSVLEAMATELPVVAFSSGRTTDILTSHDTGLLAEPGRVDQLATLLTALYEDSTVRERIGRRAREFVTCHRSWDVRVGTELGAYRKLLGHSKRHGRPADQTQTLN